MSDELGDRGCGDVDLAVRLQRVRLAGCHSFEELQALEAAGFELDDSGYWRLELAGGIEVALEPKIFGGHYLAVYRDQQLVHACKLDVELTPRTIEAS